MARKAKARTAKKSASRKQLTTPAAQPAAIVPVQPAPMLPAQPAGIVAPKPLYVSFIADVNQVTGPAIIAAIGQQLAQGFDELHLLISTPGGRVQEGLAVYNMLRSLPIRIITYNVGNVNSIGNVIFLAGEKRYASRTSSFMFHGVGFDIQNARFEEKALKERLQGLQNDQQLIADVIVRHTKITAQEVNKLFLEAAFLGTKEAKRLGIIDDIIDVQVPKGAAFLQLVFQR